MQISTMAKTTLEDKELTSVTRSIFSDSSTLPNDKLALVMTCSKISSRIGRNGIFNVSFRECESYLRDDPAALAWDGVLDLKKWFEQYIVHAQKSLLEDVFMENKLRVKSWSEINLKSKIEHIVEVINGINTGLTDLNLGQIELFSIEENDIILNDLTQIVGMRERQLQEVKLMLFTVIRDHINFSCNTTLIKIVAQ